MLDHTQRGITLTLRGRMMCEQVLGLNAERAGIAAEVQANARNPEPELPDA